MTTTRNVESLLDSFLKLNSFSFSYKFEYGFVYNKFLLQFEMPSQCALMYSLLDSMLIDNINVYLENGNELRILVVKV